MLSWWWALALVAAGLSVVGVSTPASATPIDRLSAPGDDAFEPRIAADSRGNAVAVFLSNDGEARRVQSVYRPAGGTWDAPVTLSLPGNEPSRTGPQVALDGRGRAVAVWAADTDGPMRLQAADRRADGTWSTPVTISDADRHAYDPSIAVDPEGGATVVWSSSPTTGDDPVGEILWAAHRPAGGAWEPPVKLAEDALYSDVGVDAAGHVVAVWVRVRNGIHAVDTATLPDGGSWSTPVTLSEPGRDSVASQVAVNAPGAAIVVWRGYDGTHWRLQSSYRSTGGTWSAPTTLSEAGRDAERPDVAIDAHGNAVAAWWRRGLVNVDVDAVQVADLPAGGSWTEPFTLTPDFAHALDPKVAFDPDGNLFAVWRQAEQPDWVTMSARRAVGEPWGYRYSLSERGQHAFHQAIATDGQGNAIVVWDGSDGVDNVVRATGRDYAGPISTMAGPVGPRQTATAFDVSWSAVDAWSGVGSHDVRYREAPYDGGFGPFQPWLTETATTRARFRGEPGRTYCFSSRSQDSYRRLGSWSTERCTATPVDDRSMIGRGAWKRTTGRGLYRGTQSVSRTQGDVLVLRGVRSKQLSLLVTRAPGAGKVQVSLAGEPLGRYGLGAAEVTSKALIHVRRFPAVRTGTLRIRVVSPSGRPVRIDGVVISRR